MSGLRSGEPTPAELSFREQAALEQSDPGYTNTGYDARVDFDRRTIAHNRRAAEQDRCAVRRTAVKLWSIDPNGDNQ
jgi:hypothetical protein